MKQTTGFHILVCALIVFGSTVHFISHSHAIEKHNETENETQIYTEEMAVNIKKGLANQHAELLDMKKNLEDLKVQEKTLLSEIEIYNYQNTVHDQLLLVSQPRIEDLENAVYVNRLGYRTLDLLVEQHKKRWESTNLLFQQTTDRIDLAQKEIAGIRQSQLSETEKRQLEATTKNVMQMLKEKLRLGTIFHNTYIDLLGQMNAAMDAKKAIGEKLVARMGDIKKASFFSRSRHFMDLKGETLQKELQFIRNRFQSAFRAATWKNQRKVVIRDRIDLWGILVLALTAIITLQSRFRIALQRVEERCEGPEYYYRRLALLLLHRSLPYLGMTLLLIIFNLIPFTFLNIALGRVLLLIFLLLLVTRWGSVYMEHGFIGPPSDLRSLVTRHLKRFFRFSRVTISVLILLVWIAGLDSFLSFVARGCLAVVFLLWAIVFWRQVKPALAAMLNKGQASLDSKWMAFIKGWTYLVTGGNFLLNLGGYSIMAGQWFISWIITAVVLFWGLITYNIIQEWYRQNQVKIAAGGGEYKPTTAYQMRWALIWFSRVFWFFGIAMGLLQAWDPFGALRSRLLDFFGLTFIIGDIKLSIKGMVMAVAVLFITQLAVRIGRTLIREKILDKRPYERGFKDSIVTITGYLGWGFGLLLALAGFGVNTTSLALIFGALSVGIGFGLQNIFNNFISGLILLFERPIQVGDYVEVNGQWAEVRKINVRATVVQTFDNASVIIPNSEFISQQVTNWSFKDKRMRRNIEIGVAYGSDIDLVQKTLLEIVESDPDVITHPQPEVIFLDHAASALIFRLRIWVYVGDYWIIPSRLRGEIDKRFRKAGIEIAFPQQDVHIRTLPATMRPATSDVSSGSVASI